ncbi:hypothetical protein AB1K09_01475 [Solibacillus silvestris]
MNVFVQLLYICTKHLLLLLNLLGSLAPLIVGSLPFEFFVFFIQQLLNEDKPLADVTDF